MQVDLVSETEKKDVLLAQLYAVSHLHLHLPMYPAAFIMYKLDRPVHPETGFFKQMYIRKKTYTTIQVLLSVTCVATFAAVIYAHTLMNYDCSQQYFVLNSPDMHNVTVSMQLQSSTCAYENHLRTFHVGNAAVCLLCTAVIALILLAFTRAQRTIAFNVLMFAKPFLPRLFYNGLGPWGSGHSAKRMLGDQFSFHRDLLGTLETVILCLSAAMVTACSFFGMGLWFSGLPGCTVGAAVGSAAGRLVLMFLNQFAGASDELIMMINHELQSFQPHRKVIKNKGCEIDEAYIREEVASAQKLLIARAKKLRDGCQDADAERVAAMAATVERRGFDAVLYAAQWLKENQMDVAYVQEPLFKLFSTTGSHYVCSEYELALLSLCNLPNFLVAFAAPDWSALQLLGWDVQFLLTSVYFANATKTWCTCDKDGWVAVRLQRSGEEERVSKASALAKPSEPEAYCLLEG